MAKDKSSLGSCVVVVGDPGSEFAQATVRWAREWEVDTVPCDDAYAAVVALAKAAGRRTLVVGEIRELARENRALFRIAAAHAVRCYGWLDQGRPIARKDLLPALRAGASILSDVQDIRDILKRWLATATPPRSSHGSPAKHPARQAADETYEDLRATAAELDALLG